MLEKRLELDKLKSIENRPDVASIMVNSARSMMVKRLKKIKFSSDIQADGFFSPLLTIFAC